MAKEKKKPVLRPKRVKPQFAQCRVYGHSWRPYDVKETNGHYIQVLVCTGCPNVRRDKVSRKTGEVSSRSYSYADGYLLQKGAFNKDVKNRIRLGTIRKGIHE